MNKGASPKSEDETISREETTHAKTKDAASAVVESANLVRADDDLQTEETATTQKKELKTQKLVPSNETQDRRAKPAELPDPSNDAESLETPDASPTSDRECPT